MLLNKVNLPICTCSEAVHFSCKKMDCINNERGRILLVEDDPDICTVYKIVLLTSETSPIKYATFVLL